MRLVRLLFLTGYALITLSFAVCGLGTVQALEQAAIAREAEDLREHFKERAGILEYDAGLPRPEAEIESARITATLARNRGYL